MIPLPTTGSRFSVLDSLRGICAIFVSLFHLQALSHIYFFPLIRNAFLFVDFFFVLSGFVITHAYAHRLTSPKEFVSFSIRRFGRVWPLHIAVLAAFLAAEAVNLALAIAFNFKTGHPPFDPEGHRPLSAIPFHILLLQATGVTDRLTWNFPSWSISAEFWTYLVFGTICLWFPVRKTAVLAIIGGLAIATIALFSRHGINVNYDFGLLRSVYGFAIGHVVYRLRQDGIMKSLPCISAIEFVTAFAVLCFIWLAGESAFSLAVPLMFGVAVFVFSLERGLVSRFLMGRPWQLLGEWSYSIYMVHVFVVMLIMLVVTLLQKVVGKPLFAEFIDPEVGPYRIIANINPYILDCFFILYVGVTIALAAITFRLIEMPGRRLFGQLADSIANRPSADVRLPVPYRVPD